MRNFLHAIHSDRPQPSHGIGQGTLNAVARDVLPNLTSTQKLMLLTLTLTLTLKPAKLVIRKSSFLRWLCMRRCWLPTAAMMRVLPGPETSDQVLDRVQRLAEEVPELLELFCFLLSFFNTGEIE
jgi:hypothetical protein